MRRPRLLTERCFRDFRTRTGLDQKPRELLTAVLLAVLGGAEIQVKSHAPGGTQNRERQKGSGMRPGPRRRPHEHPPFNALNACKAPLSEDPRGGAGRPLSGSTMTRFKVS